MKPLRKRVSLPALHATAVLLLVGQSVSAATLVSGDVVIIPAPPDASHMALESSDHAFLWAEQQNVVMNAPFDVTVIPFQNEPNGFYDSGNAAVEATWAGQLPAGIYSSWFMHADKNGPNVTFSGSITFDQPVVGIIHKQTELVDTDPIFGDPNTTYAGGGSGRIYELDGAANWFSISANQKTISFQTVVAHNMDDIRFILGVPEPNSILLALTVPAWFGIRRNRCSDG